MLGERFLQSFEWCSRPGHLRKVGPGVLDDFGHSRRVTKSNSALAVGISPPQAWFPPPCESPPTRIIRKQQNIDKLSFRSWFNHQLRLRSADRIRGGRRPHILIPDQGNEFVAQRWTQAARLGFGCGVHRSASVALRDSRGFERVRHVTPLVFPPQRRGVGKIFVGFESCSGSKAQRTRCMVTKSGSANIFDIIFFLSSPTPCSPVIEPPAAMHNSRILLERASAAFS